MRFCITSSSLKGKRQPQDRGKGLALFTASSDTGVMAGSFTYGAVAAYAGYAHMYDVAAAVMLIAVAIVRFFRN